MHLRTSIGNWAALWELSVDPVGIEQTLVDRFSASEEEKLQGNQIR